MQFSQSALGRFHRLVVMAQPGDAVLFAFSVLSTEFPYWDGVGGELLWGSLGDCRDVTYRSAG